MSNPLYEALTGLVEKWEQRATALANDREVMRDDRVKARILRECKAAVEAALAAAVPAPPQEEGPLLDRVEAAINGPGYSVIRAWLAIHGGASARIVLEEITQLVRTLGALPASPAVPQGWQPLNTWDYRNAPSGEGPQAAEWKNKPHRLIYDLCREIERMRGLRYDADMNQVLPAPPSALLGGLEDREGQKNKDAGLLGNTFVKSCDEGAPRREG